MRRRKFIAPLAVTAFALLGVLGGPGLGTAHAATPAHPPGAFVVNVSSSTFYDPYRGTPARSGVPAHNGRTIHEVIYDPVGVNGPLPSVMFAPGFDNQSATYDPLLRTVASAGYLVVGVDSPGASNYFPGAPYFTPAGRDVGNNTIDLSAALDNIEASPLGFSVDRSSVAAMGHSDGGYVPANLALNPPYHSSRFNAYVSLSGGVPYGLVPGSFGASNNGPMLVMIGTNDEYGNYAPPCGASEQVYCTAQASRILVTMNGATHLSGFIGAGPQPDDVRAAITNFLNVAEKQDAGSRAAFNNEVNSNGLVTQADLNAAWYAAPPPPPPSGIPAYYAQQGGASGWLGAPTDTAYISGPGVEQDFAGGDVYWSQSTGAHSVRGAILGHYQYLGGPSGFLGLPLTDETPTADGVGRYSAFSGGNIYWSPASGAHAVRGAILAHYLRRGGPTGFLGYPVTDETGYPGMPYGRYSAFGNGDILWTGATGAWSIHGSILGHYQALGGPYGVLGYPVTDETGTPDGIGRYNQFSGGGGASIYWSPSTGAWSVHGAIRGTWASIGRETSRIGYPISDEFGIPGGRQNNFQRGYIIWSDITGITHIFG